MSDIVTEAVTAVTILHSEQTRTAGSLLVFQDMQHMFPYSCYCASALAISHALACLFVAFMDLSGRWTEYALDKERKVSLSSYLRGLRSFCANLCVLFVPIMAAVLAVRRDAILSCTDAWWVSAAKLYAGYTLGKIWAFGVHLALHTRPFYFMHKAHHPRASSLVASHAWLDSWMEYLVMEMPSFCIMTLVLPTHFVVHLAFFCWHGIGAAGDHSGFKPPGILRYVFDGALRL